MTKKILGIIPARGGSKSILRKNLIDLAGKPLIAYSIVSAKASGTLTRVIVSTDDAEIAAYAASQGVDVPFLRPTELATDQAPILPVIRHLLTELESREKYRPDAIVLLQPTSPLRTAAHIDEAVSLLFSSDSDSVVTVTEVPHQFNPYSVMSMSEGLLTPFLSGEGNNIYRRQDKPKVFARNGPAVLVSKYSTIMEMNSLYGHKCAGFEMKAEESVDVDIPFDLEIVNFLLNKNLAKSN